MSNKRHFAIIGVGGYIAPRHLEAIHAVGGSLVAALDKNDSVGIIDRYFSETAFFTEIERFDRYLEKLKRQNKPIDYLVICSPNYLHDAHIRLGLRYGAQVICEKPIVLNPWNIDGLLAIEQESQSRVNTILQLRLHPSIIELKNKIDDGPKNKRYAVDLSYLTARGNWYYTSWKGDEEKSGGVATNIGIHFFDMLIWVFGPVQSQEIHVRSHDRAGGFMVLEKADVKWFLSINKSLLPVAKRKTNSAYRNISINGENIEFSTGFEQLHTQSYHEIIHGRGYTMQDARPSIDCVHQIRTLDCKMNEERAHDMSLLPLSIHPFKK